MKRRDAGVGILMRQCKDGSFDDPDSMDDRIMAMNIKVNGFNIRLVNAYAPTNCDDSVNKKYIFYRTLRKKCVKQYKHQKLVVNGDFNATTSVSTIQCHFDGIKLVNDQTCNENGLKQELSTGPRLVHFN